jgi:hypothetical protein
MHALLPHTTTPAVDSGTTARTIFNIVGDGKLPSNYQLEQIAEHGRNVIVLSFHPFMSIHRTVCKGMKLSEII